MPHTTDTEQWSNIQPRVPPTMTQDQLDRWQRLSKQLTEDCYSKIQTGEFSQGTQSLFTEATKRRDHAKRQLDIAQENYDQAVAEVSRLEIWMRTVEDILNRPDTVPQKGESLATSLNRNSPGPSTEGGLEIQHRKETP